MAYYAIVIADADLAHAKERERGHRQPKARAAGSLHAHLESDCPDGRPNCRHCGDPAQRDDCLAKGHCPDCGTKHGIAPDAVIAANGYALLTIDPPADGHVWDPQAHAFVKP